MRESDRVDAALDALYAASPDAFVDERKRLAKELRSAGDRAAAARVAKLRKPSAAAWALNHVAREAPAAVEEWRAAGERLREASSRPGEVGGEGVRAAIAGHRAATARLLDVVRERARPGGRPLSEDMLDRVRELLMSASTDADRAERLRRGRSTGEPAEEPAATSQPEAAPSPPADAPARPAPAARRDEAAARKNEAEARRREAEARRRSERAAELERRIRAAEAEIERLAARHGEGITAAGKADKQVEAARRALRAAEARAHGARIAVRDHEQALSAARADLEDLRAEHQEHP